MSLENLNKICESSTALGKILQKSSQLNQLTEQVQALLAEPLREHVRVANYRENELMLAVDAALWATELRYKIPELLPKLQSQIDNLKTIDWFVLSQ